MRSELCLLTMLLAIGCGTNERLTGSVDVNDLRRRLKDERATVRQDCLAEIATLQASLTEELMPDLCEALTDGSDAVRFEAVKTLQTLGPSARKALEPLTARLKAEKVARIRKQIVQAVGDIDPDHGDGSLKVLVLALKDTDPQVSQEAMKTLPGFGANAIAALPALREILSKGDHASRSAACYVLAELGPAAESALPELKKLQVDAAAVTAGTAEETEQAKELNRNAAHAIRCIEAK